MGTGVCIGCTTFRTFISLLLYDFVRMAEARIFGTCVVCSDLGKWLLPILEQRATCNGLFKHRQCVEAASKWIDQYVFPFVSYHKVEHDVDVFAMG